MYICKHCRKILIREKGEGIWTALTVNNPNLCYNISATDGVFHVAEEIVTSYGEKNPGSYFPKKVVRREEIIDIVNRQLVLLTESRDKEVAHLVADKILCELLGTLGYREVVEKFKNMVLWYG